MWIYRDEKGGQVLAPKNRHILCAVAAAGVWAGGGTMGRWHKFSSIDSTRGEGRYARGRRRRWRYSDCREISSGYLQKIPPCK